MTTLSQTDLANAKLDLDHIAEIANSVALTATDRLGGVKPTLKAAIDTIKAINSRGAWTPVTAYAIKDLVSNGGTWYLCVTAHNSSAVFATDEASKWRVHQGLTSDAIAAPSGSSLWGFLPAGASAVASTVESKLRESVSLADKSSQAEPDAAQDSILVPKGSHASAITSPSGSYHGAGVLTVGNLSLNLLNDQAPKGIKTVTLGNLTTIDSAISAGAAKVVFWGDSITEGVSQVAYEDSFPGLMQAHLTDSLQTVTWTFENYAIAGSAASDAVNAAYVGAASDSYPTQFLRTAGSANVGNFQKGTPLWPAGSTIAKSWANHVKDASPDLLVIAFGANAVTTTAFDYANTLAALIILINTWTKVPSIVFVTNLQATRKIPLWLGYNANLQDMAEVTRTVGRQNNITVVDANRLHLAYRDGFDVCRPSKRLCYNFAGGFTDAWPIGWESNGAGLPTVSGTYNLTFGTTCVTEKQDSAKDVMLSAVFVPAAAASSVFGIVYRSVGVSSADKYTAHVVTSADGLTSTCILYHAGGAIASGGVAAVTNGEQVLIEVECVGPHHVVKVRGVVSIDMLDYRKLSAGKYGVQWGAGTGTVANWVARVGNYRVVGAPKLTDDIVYGAVNDWVTNDASLGGDTIHHPSAIGHHAVYLKAFDGLLSRLEQSANQPKIQMVTDFVNDTTTTLAAGDYLDLSIAGVSNGSVMLGVGTADASYGASVANIKSITGTSAVVTLQKNGVVFLTKTLALPGGGDWVVIAAGTASAISATKRHTLTALAIKK